MVRSIWQLGLEPDGSNTIIAAAIVEVVIEPVLKGLH